MYPSNQRSVTRPGLCRVWRHFAVDSDVMELEREREGGERRRRQVKEVGWIGVVWILFLCCYVTLSRAVDTQVSSE